MLFKDRITEPDWSLGGEVWTENIIDVSAGKGGLPMLIIGSEKAALIDQGMSFCGNEMVEKIEHALDGRELDYAIMTHSHYNHIEGLYHLKKKWNNIITLAHQHCMDILEKESALRKINDLFEVARLMYAPAAEQISEEDMKYYKVDMAIKEGDYIDLGDRGLRVMHTPGHTECSLSFVLEPLDIIFPNESIGVLEADGTILTAFDKSYKSTVESIDRCKAVGAEHIVSPHFGPVPENIKEKYWDMAKESAEMSKNFILKRYTEGKTPEEILREYKQAFWIDGVDDDRQPIEAFLINVRAMIAVIWKEFVEKGQ